jgi:hypothetical protein
MQKGLNIKESGFVLTRVLTKIIFQRKDYEYTKIDEYQKIKIWLIDSDQVTVICQCTNINMIDYAKVNPVLILDKK